MQNRESRIRLRGWPMTLSIVVLCALTVLLDFIKISYTKDAFRNRMLGEIVQQTCGVGAAILLIIKSNIKLFNKPQAWLFLIPCVIIAVDNFPFWDVIITREISIVNKNPLDILLFAGYCLAVGLFEEIIFRGIVFSVIASLFENSKKGFISTYVVSSLIFGAAHIFNGVSLGTLLQIGYTTLTGGMFAFALIKTKNIFCPAFIHAVYNFCGISWTVDGLGTGKMFGIGTAVTMLIVCICCGAFILYHVWKYSDEERNELYAKLNVKGKRKD